MGRTACILAVALSTLNLAAISAAQDPGTTGVSVTTWQNDTHRTGRNLNEGTLVTNGGTTIPGLQQICASATLDGQVYAQPLIETSVTLNNKYYKYGAAYVVTQNDTLYAVDANPNDGGTPCGVISSLPFASGFERPDPHNPLACTVRQHWQWRLSGRPRDWHSRYSGDQR